MMQIIDRDVIASAVKDGSESVRGLMPHDIYYYGTDII